LQYTQAYVVDLLYTIQLVSLYQLYIAICLLSLQLKAKACLKAKQTPDKGNIDPQTSIVTLPLSLSRPNAT